MKLPYEAPKLTCHGRLPLWNAWKWSRRALLLSAATLLFAAATHAHIAFMVFHSVAFTFCFVVWAKLRPAQKDWWAL